MTPKAKTTGDDGYRIEHDTMGEVRVPKAAKWQAQTQRAVENFPISGLPVERALIEALAAIKGATAQENARIKTIDRKMATAIADAATEVMRGDWDDEFPVDVYQTGSGTSTNMNMNEVLATLASEKLGGDTTVHPNDHVNGLSSNDMFPSAIHIAAALLMKKDLIPALEHLAATLRKKQRAFKNVVKSGSHPLDGRHAGDPRPGVRRLRAVSRDRHRAVAIIFRAVV